MRDRVLAQEWFPGVDIAGWAESVVDFLRTYLDVVFDLVRVVVGNVVGGVESVLLAPPALVMIAILTFVAFVARRWAFAGFALVAFLLVHAMGRFDETMETLALVVVAAALAVAIGVPIGILAARRPTVSASIRPVLDFMQTMPSFVYLLLVVIFFRIGAVPGVMAALVFSMPPAVRLTELGIRGVDREVVEAAEAFGARPREILTGVQLPLARPTIMAGVNQVIMLALSMVVIAGLGGAGGLGGTIVQAIQRYQPGNGIEGGLAVVVLAIFLDRVTAAFGSGEASISKAA